ncbi:MAG: hypothetical protein QM790_06655 [Nibricoccus sp.]
MQLVKWRTLLGLAAGGLCLFKMAAQEKPPRVSLNKETPSFLAPTNEVIRLPKFLVRPSETPRFGNEDIFSKESLDAFLAKKYPGAGLRKPIPGVDNYALLMYQDDRRLASMARFTALSAMLRTSGDFEGSRELDAEINDTFLRRPSWRERAMDRNLNSNRR